jgi:type II secretory pathway component PulJ
VNGSPRVTGGTGTGTVAHGSPADTVGVTMALLPCLRRLTRATPLTRAMFLTPGPPLTPCPTTNAGRPRAGRVRTRAAAGAFTLLELVVVAAISSVLFLLLIKWVLTLASASSATLEGSSTERTAQIAQAAFGADVANAVPCAEGQGSPIRQITPDAVEFYRTAPSGTSIDLVAWRIVGTSLQRSYVSHQVGDANTCDTPTDPLINTGAVSWQTFSNSVGAVQSAYIESGVAGLRPAFATVTNGQTVTDPVQAWGNCTQVANVNDQRCFAAAITVYWLFLSPVTGSQPSTVSRNYAFTPTAGDLS